MEPTDASTRRTKKTVPIFRQAPDLAAKRMLPMMRSKQTKAYGDKSMDIYTLEMQSITGETVSFAQFRGQTLLIVNLASQ